MIQLSTIDQAIILGYFLLVLFINVLSKKLSQGLLVKDKEKNLENYFLAGRRLTLPLFVGTLVTTWYGNLLGVGEISYKHGMVNWLTQGFFWYLIYIFFAFVLVKKIKKFKLFTIPDQLEKFYDKKTAIAGAFVNLFMLTPASYILALGIVFQIIFNFDPKWGILLGTLVPLFYTLRGGFTAVVFTDFIQFIFMFIGVAAIIPFALIKYGGSFFIQNAPESHLSITGDWSMQVILVWFLIAFWAVVDSGFYQRVYAAKDEKVAQKGIFIATAFWFVFDMLITAIGIFAYTANPELDPKMSLPFFANDVLPVVFKGIFFTGLLATIMSTLDSLVFSSSMCLSHDIYQRIFNIKDEKKVIWVNKIAIVLVVLVGLSIALFFSSIMDIIYTRGTIGISALLVPMLFGFFAKDKINPKAALVSVLGGTFVSIFWIFQKETGLFASSSLMQIEALYPGLVASLLGFIICQKVCSLPSSQHKHQHGS